MKVLLYNYLLRKCRRVVDGDTIDVEIDLGFYQFGVYRVRLLGVDTPELRDRDPDERERAKEAKTFVVKWFAAHIDCIEGGEVVVNTEKADSFGRFLATIACLAHNTTLASELLESGHAKVYRGR